MKRKRPRPSNAQRAETDLHYANEKLKELNEKIVQLESAKRASQEVERIRAIVDRHVKNLARRAKNGEQLAALALATVAATAVDELNSLAEQHPAIFLPLSRRVFDWPCAVSRKRADSERNRRLLDRLEVGKESVYNRRAWQPSAPTTRVAMKVLNVARRMERDGQLPRLTKTTKHRWFEQGWKRALWAGWKPEEDRRLSRIGQSKANKKPKYCKKLHPATRQSNLRAAIKGQVWNAFNNLVAAR